MGSWVLATLLIVYCNVQGYSYMVTDVSIEKLAPAPKTNESDLDYSTIEPKRSKQAFKPSKQLFSNILLLSGEPEQPQRYDKVYEETHIIAPVSETRKYQIKKPEEISYGFPTEIINYDEDIKQQSIEIYSKTEGEISHEPIAHKVHSVGETVVTYNDPIPYLPEKQSINSGPTNQKRKEIHYHQHKHLHDHKHKQDHLHKHRQDHVHDHGHTHQDNDKHEHHHLGQHGHHYIDAHYHNHEGSHNHEHQSSHQHDHHDDKHSHTNNHKGEHSHDHHGTHDHDHKHRHERHSKYRHPHKNKNTSKHNSKHMLVPQKIIIKKYQH